MDTGQDQAGATRAAVLGTGIMGSAMARNLIAAGLPTTVWDRSASATAPLAEAGARVAPSAADAVAGASVVIMMLPTADIVTAVLFDGGVARGVRGRCGVRPDGHDRRVGHARDRRRLAGSGPT